MPVAKDLADLGFGILATEVPPPPRRAPATPHPPICAPCTPDGRLRPGGSADGPSARAGHGGGAGGGRRPLRARPQNPGGAPQRRRSAQERRDPDDAADHQGCAPPPPSLRSRTCKLHLQTWWVSLCLAGSWQGGPVTLRHRRTSHPRSSSRAGQQKPAARMWRREPNEQSRTAPLPAQMRRRDEQGRLPGQVTSRTCGTARTCGGRRWG